MNTKGDMTLNIIMVAVILLITVLVVIAIFTGKMGSWGKKVSELQETSCTQAGYKCKASCASDEIRVYGFTCSGTDICCRKA